MAEKDSKKEREQQQNDDFQQELRENVNDAYAFVEGQKTTQTFACITFEDLMDQQIERLVGKDTDARPNVIHKLENVAQKIVQAVEQIKKLPNNFFQHVQKDDNVNTPEVEIEDEAELIKKLDEMYKQQQESLEKQSA